MIRRPPRSTLDRSSAASDVYKRQPAADKEIVDLGFPRDATVVAILRDEKVVVPRGDTCLLYTSPSPRDRTRSRMPSSAWKKKKYTRNTRETLYTRYYEEIARPKIDDVHQTSPNIANIQQI